MTPEEKFLFDLEGYLIVEEVLTPGEIDALNTTAEEVFTEDYDYSRSHRPLKKYPGTRSASFVSLWGPPYRDLIDHPKIVPYLVDVLGPKYRRSKNG